ncbi:phage portal protein [Pectinatus frisingensis]|uniref:phage portal protein n=1 Tax=Pectinatus frisingensis TaxID=865 RepID=UPI0018C64799|nr:phage portal protein [Pectinatus frisingensis]
MKINFRSMFNTIFNRPDNSIDTIPYQQYKLLNYYDNYFTPYDGNAYDDATVRTCIDAVARNAAKLKPTHYRNQGGKATKTDDTLDSLLSTRPNEYMSTYDFLYKIVSQLYSYNNAFVYIRTDNAGNILGLYPLNYDDVTLREANNQLYLQFDFLQAGQITVPYTSLIHLRKHFNRGDFFGESNERPLKSPLNILNSVKQGLENLVKNSTKLRGWVSVNGNIRPEDIDETQKDFSNKFLSTSTGTGVAVLDKKYEYHQLTSDIQTADHTQMGFAREDIYRYFGLSESIVTNTYTEAEWTAFYQSVIEPLAIQLSQEFTAKLFTEREKGYGNEIKFTSNRLDYASTQSKVNIVNTLLPQGIITINEAREVFGFSDIENGDKRLVSLNFVNADKQDIYQNVNDDSNNSAEGGDNDDTK